MLEQLLPYYEKELGYLRDLSKEFSSRYPKIAQRLSMEGDQCEDPHVERLIEAFAFMAARIHRRLDDEYPEITEAFLQTLYPHYIRPIPAITILSMEMDQAKPALTGGYRIPRHQQITTPTINGEPCHFRTTYDVDLLPLQLTAAKLELTQASPFLRSQAEAHAALTLDFSVLGNAPIAALNIDKLRFFIDGEPQVAHFIYELLFSNCLRVDVSEASDNPSSRHSHASTCIEAVGFRFDEALLDYDERSLPGYRLLTEYFCYPEKFLFFDVTQLKKATSQIHGQTLRLRFWLDGIRESNRYQQFIDSINADNFKLFCTPAINLFRRGADPIRLDHLSSAYPVIPDGRRPLAYEIISIDSVMQIDKSGKVESTHEIPPLYSTHHRTAFEQQQAYWYSTRESALHEFDHGTDVFLSLVDLNFQSTRPETETLSIICTCSNRDGPEHLPFGGNAPLYHIPGHSIVQRVRPLRKPSRAVRPPEKKGLQWRLISHLSLNILSLVSEGKSALQEMLTLYNFSNDLSNARQIRALQELTSKPALARIGGNLQHGFVRGTQIEVTLNEDEFIGTGAYLFSSVLERFFGLYCAPNSFTQLHVHTTQRGKDLFSWPPRSGDAALI
ncbi:MAG: type VI secretion system baseplate subunit TssF [Spongiibacteraceae bacterium]